MPVRLAAFAFIGALSAAAQATIQGTVHDTADRSPIPDAQVLAIAGEPRRIIASARTDTQGRYRLEVGKPRFELTADAFGYFIVQAGDVQGDRIARACDEDGGCEDTDFVLSKAAVLDGWITDKYGNPKATVELTLKTAKEAAEDPPGRRRRSLIPVTQERNRNRTTVSDDRGYFRFWGLRPGSYRMTSKANFQRYPGFPAPTPLDREIEIPAGEEAVRVSVQMTEPPPTYTISGRLEGVDANDPRWITLEPLDGGSRQTVYVKDGSFTHPAPAGEYAARLEQVVNADSAAHPSDSLGTIVVEGDRSDIVLRPQPPSGVRVRLRFLDGEPTAARVEFRHKDRPTAHPRVIQFPDAGAEVERGGFLPGTYAAHVASGEFFVAEPVEATVFPGQLTEVELPLSRQRAVVRGKARFAAEEGKTDASQITVGIRGRETRSMQTDDAGGFVFEKLIPGEYEIAAWARRQVDAGKEDVWREAGDRVKRITVEPGFEVEVDLTIAP